MIIGAATVAALCLTGGGIAFAVQPSGDHYRTAVATTASVSQTAALTGTIASASRADAAFEVAGTVASVPVSLGQQVAAGQTLATLDPDSLQAAITSAQQTVTQGSETLATDLASQTTSAMSTSSSASASPAGTTPSTTALPSAGSGSTGSASGGSAGSKADSAALEAAAKAVTDAQKALLAQVTIASAALADTQSTVAAAAPTCAPFLAAALDDTGAGTTGDGTTSTGGSTTAPGDGTISTGSSTPTRSTLADQLAAAKAALASCQTSVTAALTSQQKTADAQTSVQTLAVALDDAVAAYQKEVASSPAEGSGTSATPVASPSSTPAATTPTAPTVGTSGGAGMATTQTASAATIVADRAAVDAANAKLAVAQHVLDFATLSSPIAGTVAAVSIASGESVSAESTTSVITVLGDDGYVINATVSLAKVTTLEIGQAATATATGESKAITGTVSSIGVVNTSTDSSTPTYAVTVAVATPKTRMLNGAAAKVTVSVKTVHDALTVPTSAVTIGTDTSTVQVLRNGEVQRTIVKLGAVGSDRTVITSGLSRAAVVVLADLTSTTVGTSSTTSTGGISGLTSGSTTGRDNFQGGPPGN